MNVLVYGLALLMAVLVELYPMYRPMECLKDYEVFVTLLQMVVAVLMLFCSYFYGRM